MTEGKLFTLCSAGVESRKMVVNNVHERYHLENGSPTKRRPSVVSLAFEIKRSASVVAAAVANANNTASDAEKKEDNKWSCSSCSNAITGFIEKCFYW